MLGEAGRALRYRLIKPAKEQTPGKGLGEYTELTRSVDTHKPGLGNRSDDEYALQICDMLKEIMGPQSHGQPPTPSGRGLFIMFGLRSLNYLDANG